MSWFDDWTDDGVGVLDVAVPFYGATRWAAKGGKAVYDWADDGLSGGGGGSGDFKPYTAGDSMNYRYGGDPNAPNAAVSAATNKATQTGDAGMQLGQFAINRGDEIYGKGNALLDQRTNDAVHFDNRAVQQGDFGAQNQSLGALGSLEATQGPSAAQAQLQAGTNQALAGQLALARSGRGLGGNAAAMGQAQGNVAGIQANQANQAAGLRAQEDAAWRGRQAANLTNVAGMQGQQSQANLGAAVQGRGQNDAMAQGMLGLGQNAYQYGADQGMRGYGMAMEGTDRSLAGQGLAHDIRGQEMTGNIAEEDAKLRAWAAENGYTLTQQQLADQKEAAYLNAAATFGASYASGGMSNAGGAAGGRGR